MSKNLHKKDLKRIFSSNRLSIPKTSYLDSEVNILLLIEIINILNKTINILDERLPAATTSEEIKEPCENLPFDRNLLKKVDELELSVRSAKCLKYECIIYIGDLVQKSESDILKIPNFGRKSFNEIKEVIYQMGLDFGMTIPNWPPENIEDLIKRLKREEANDDC